MLRLSFSWHGLAGNLVSIFAVFDFTVQRRVSPTLLDLRSYLGATGLETDECEQHMALCKPFLSIRHHRMMWPAFRSGDLCVYAPLRKPVYPPVSRELSQFPAESPSDKEI